MVDALKNSLLPRLTRLIPRLHVPHPSNKPFFTLAQTPFKLSRAQTASNRRQFDLETMSRGDQDRMKVVHPKGVEPLTF
jgi:hypothetical protein